MSAEAASATRTTARLGVATALAVAVPVLLAQLSGDAAELVGAPVAWWLFYLAYVVPLAMNVEEWPRPPTPVSDRVVLAVMAVSGMAVVVVAPTYGFTIVLPIITACAATFIVGVRIAVVLATVQVVGVAIVYAVATEASVGDAVLQATTWAGFMGFAILTVEAGQREGRARVRLARVNDELAHANDRLARANADLEAAQQLLAVSSRNAERLRISRDLHDLIGHQLTALSLQLEAASHRDAGAATDNVRRSREIARGLLDDVRDVVGRLREDVEPVRTVDPAVGAPEIGRSDVVAPGLDVPASMRAAAAAVDPLRVQLDVDEAALPDDDERALALVRIVQEVLTNTARHADARRVWIRVETIDGQLRVFARDDGHGAPVIVDGNGLVGMRERVAALGGRLRTWSPPGDGFHLEATLPAPSRVP